MSRIGKMPITIPAGVTVTIGANNEVTVKGPKGELVQKLPADMILDLNGDVLEVKRPSEIKEHKSMHGLTRTLIANMVVGVTEGFKKELQINGVGYRAAKQGNKLVMNLGYSHQVEMEDPEGITVEVPQPNQIIISGADKQKVGQFAANVREKRPPEPYKGKGIKYIDEHIRRKEGKAGSKK
ncbi:MAG: 50S ribosomal protein L6 [Clostridia bacterium]|nr:50S ribosomal protein L6 [Clostridia bacterium]